MKVWWVGNVGESKEERRKKNTKLRENKFLKTVVVDKFRHHRGVVIN